MKFSKLPTFVITRLHLVSCNLKQVIVPLILSIIFFIIAFLTLNDYGPSWDETIHFRRGQAYLHYFLTGEKEYIVKKSFYQNDIQNGKYFLNKDIGHPPLNDLMAASLNYFFYQKLGIMDDISSHHLFNILASTFLIFIVTFFASRYFGFFPSFVSFLSLLTYPLFFAESHFNIKDPAETAFFSATLLSFILSLEKKSFRWLIISALFFALALGTKFNILFLPLIIVPYLFISGNQIRRFKKSYFFTFAFTPIIVISILILSWPYLWHDTLSRFMDILTFYKEIGSGTRYQPDSFFTFGFNTYPILWIIYSTPPFVLILAVLGIISAWINRNLNRKITLIILLWFLIPITRVSIPGTSIYGGVRQILEFLPALALLSGLGAWQITKWIRSGHGSILVKVLIILAFLWPTVVLVKLHPYQNVYFNFLIGGLKGASEANFPSWGNSLGNAYQGGIKWINENAEKGAKLTLIQGTPSNVPPILLREDINYLADGSIDPKIYHFSGIERHGEYIMELTFNDTGRDFYYAWEYVENFLNPVYELKVENVPILKIWKNNLDHTKDGFKLAEKEYKGSVDINTSKQIIISLQDVNLVSRLTVSFKNERCNFKQSGFIETSLDGKVWQRERDIFPQYQAYRKLNLTDSKLEYFFAGRKLKYIRVLPSSPDSCILKDPQIKIVIL